MARSKAICLVKSCRKELFHLSRHMRDVDGLPQEEAKNVRNLYGLRKGYVYKKKDMDTGKSCKSKVCPVYGCRTVVKNMSRHLKVNHKMNAKNLDYKKLLLQAVVVELPTSKLKLTTDFPSTSGNVPLTVPMEEKFNSSDDETFDPSGESSSLSDGVETIESFQDAKSPKSGPQTKAHQKLLKVLTVAQMAVVLAWTQAS